MRFLRRQFLHLATGAAALPALPRSAEAQAYPTRSITMIVPFPAGGAADAVARILAEQMRGSLGQPLIIENVSGAGGNIGLSRLVRARPDGYMIELGTISSNMLNGALYSLPYDLLNDFTPISPLVTLPPVLYAGMTMPAKDLNEIIAWLKANPSKASTGFGAATYRLLTMLFQKETATRFTLVPYRGGAPAVQDLLAGQIDLYFGALDSLSLVRAGSLKAYAVASDTRSALAPDLPTFAELGLPTLTFSNWYAFFAPKGTSKEIVYRLNAAAVEALADPEVRPRLANIGVDIFPRAQQTPEVLTALVRTDAEKWWPIIKEFGIKEE
jgi:tripartite-type tricarboxylate transporter receptor subunit TctC